MAELMAALAKVSSLRSYCSPHSKSLGRDAEFPQTCEAQALHKFICAIHVRQWLWEEVLFHQATYNISCQEPCRQMEPEVLSKGQRQASTYPMSAKWPPLWQPWLQQRPPPGALANLQGAICLPSRNRLCSIVCHDMMEDLACS